MRRAALAALSLLLLSGCSPLESERLYDYTMIVRSEIKRRLPKPESVPRVDRPEGAEALLRAEATATSTLSPSPTPLPTPSLTPTPTETLDPPAEPETAQAAEGAEVAEAENTGPAPSPTTPPAAAVNVQDLPARASLQGASHEYQRWNNCGPATLAMYLSYWGLGVSQYDTEKFLKPDREDKNVTPWEMAAYARQQGFEAFVGTNGSLQLVKALLAHSYPVIVERWFLPFGPEDGMGHYGLVLGYDEGSRSFRLFDSYNGPNVTLDYGEMDRMWQVFNRTFVLAYYPSQHDEVEAILTAFGGGLAEAQHGSPGPMHQAALERARQEAEADPGNAFAWFNLGTNLTALGRYAEATQAFDQARYLGLPWRMLWYQFGPFEAYYHVGRHQDVLDLARANLAQTGPHEESYYWQGLSLRALGREEEARRNFEAALRFNPHYEPAREALN